MNTTVVPPYRDHLASSDDLVTTYEAIRAGFVALALEKNRRATPYIAEARALQVAASSAKTPAELPTIRGHREWTIDCGRAFGQITASSATTRQTKRIGWLDQGFPRTCRGKVRRRTRFQVPADPRRHPWRLDAKHRRSTGSAKTDSSHHFDAIDCGNQVPMARLSNTRVARPNQRRFRHRVLAERIELASQQPESHLDLQSDGSAGEEQCGPVPV